MPSEQQQLAAALLELERRERVKRAENDLEFFKHKYFRHYMLNPVTGEEIGDAPFHKQIMQDLQEAVKHDTLVLPMPLLVTMRSPSMLR